jgi:hypothetical protein
MKKQEEKDKKSNLSATFSTEKSKIHHFYNDKKYGSDINICISLERIKKDMKNMIEDVCELGSILQSGDEEKIALERKLVELDGAIQAQDRRVRLIVTIKKNVRSKVLRIKLISGNSFLFYLT